MSTARQHRRRLQRATRTMVLLLTAAVIALVLNAAGLGAATLAAAALAGLAILFATAELVRHIQKWRP